MVFIFSLSGNYILQNCLIFADQPTEMTKFIHSVINLFVMKKKKDQSLEKLKSELQVLSKEEMQRIRGGSREPRFNPKWFHRCEGRMPQ